MFHDLGMDGTGNPSAHETSPGGKVAKFHGDSRIPSTLDATARADEPSRKPFHPTP